ncbi:MAG: polysaccharide biosynthesis protein [Rubricoccaceae bacterium]
MNRPRRGRQAAKLALDLSLWTLATALAFGLRLEEHLPDFVPGLLLLLAVGLPLKAALVVGFALPRRSWQGTALPDLFPLAAAVVAGAAMGLVVAQVSPLPIPRSVPLIEIPIALLLLGTVRVSARLWFEERNHRVGRRVPEAARRVLVVGAGSAGQTIVREMRRNPSARLVPVGFLDDDPLKGTALISGLRVLGQTDELERVARACNADEVVIAMPSAEGPAVRRVVEAAGQAGLPARIVPALCDLITGVVSISQLREVNLEDLLRRQPVRLETDAIADMITGRRVLITGAGGSIGSEIARQVCRFAPSAVVLLGRGENSIFHIQRELAAAYPDLEQHAVITDVRDFDSLAGVFARHRPHLVFHAAAHKHVPLMEANPEQAVLNNVLGTRNVADLCLEHGVRRLVNVSTDKAVNPSSVMGASKRVAEMVVQRASARCAEGCAFVSVRFGNVLGSRGSVVPLFKEQIARGGPVRVTHPDMVRYFMTIPEASQLVLQASALGGNGRVYVLDMGEPVRIVDLARDLILLSGLTPDVDVAIEFTGTRPGEKLFEELLTAEEGTEASRHEKIFVARQSRFAHDAFELQLAALREAAFAQDGAEVRRILRRIVPTFVTPEAPPAPSPAAPGGGVFISTPSSARATRPASRKESESPRLAA